MKGHFQRHCRVHMVTRTPAGTNALLGAHPCVTLPSALSICGAGM